MGKLKQGSDMLRLVIKKDHFCVSMKERLAENKTGSKETS